MSYQTIFKEEISEEEFKLIDDGIVEHQRMLFGEVDRGNLAFFVRDDAGRTAGGVTGNWSSFGWLYVNSLWVDERLRGQRFGTRLMELIEKAAIKHGCQYSYLNTMTYQAPDFYRKLGYEEFARLENFPPGYSRLFFRKTLRESSDEVTD